MEALILSGVNDPDRNVVLSALIAMPNDQKINKNLAIQLKDVLVNSSSSQWASMARDRNLNVDSRILVVAFDKLKRQETIPLVPGLLKSMGRPSRNVFKNAVLAQVIGSSKDLNAIHNLMPFLEDQSVQFTYLVDNKEMSIAFSDSALLAVLELTNNSVAEFGLVQRTIRLSHNHSLVLSGFRTMQTRQSAILKFKKWWAEKSKAKPYLNTKGYLLPPPQPASRFPLHRPN